MKTKIFKSAAALLLAAVFCAGAACALSACGGAEFLPDYDISGVSLQDDTAADDYFMTIGGEYFEAKTYNEGGFSMKYRIHVPENAEGAVPVMLFFHGSGERGDDNEMQLSYAGFREAMKTEELAGSIVIAPQCPSGSQWVDFTREEGSFGSSGLYSTDETPESEPLAAVLKLLKYYVENPPEGAAAVDTARIYAMGLSMGGYATWDLLVRHTDVIAAGVPICGGCDTSKAELLKDKKIYAFHGAKDPIVPPVGTRAMYEQLSAYGNMEYVEYADGMHDIWNDAISTPGLYEKVYAARV